MKCELCGHPYSHKHRVYPGVWGGTYEASNVVRLCPNHHAAIHFLMARHYRNRWDARKGLDRLRFYERDAALWSLWVDRVRPIVEPVRRELRPTGAELAEVERRYRAGWDQAHYLSHYPECRTMCRSVLARMKANRDLHPLIDFEEV